MFASNATNETVYKLSPGLLSPLICGDGFPVPKNKVLLSLSIAGVVHAEPPPYFAASGYFTKLSFSY